MKKIMISAMIVLSFVVLLGGIYSTLAQEKVDKGANWETTCNEETCQTIIYSYEKYWYNSQGNWEEIDENWFDCSSPEETKFCTKEYYFKVEANDFGFVNSLIKSEDFGMKLSKFENSTSAQLAFEPEIEGSVLTYPNIFPELGNIDLRYQYLPSKLKEEIVLNGKIANIKEDFEISFDITGNAKPGIVDFTICDSNITCEYLDAYIENDKITLSIPADFLNNESTVYPVIIDPTIELNGSNVNWNGYISFSGTDPPSYTRFNNPTILQTVQGGKRASFDWDLSSIPDGSDILNATLDLKVSSGAYPYNLSTWHMEGNNNTYPDTTGDCEGNCLFYNDMGNGTQYNKSYVDFGNGHVITYLSFSAISDLENSLAGDTWSVGVTVDNGGTTVLVGGKDNSNQDNRPKLTITYGANQTNANEAIEEGIANSALSGNPIESSQQVYLVDDAGSHYLGLFDKATMFGNQTWAFYYAENAGSLIGMPSLFRILNVWENHTLSYEEIVSQVESFINGTIY